MGIGEISRPLEVYMGFLQTTRRQFFLAVTSTLLARTQSSGQSDRYLRSIPARMVPAPTSVSPLLREKIAEPIEQNMKQTQSLVLETPEQWRQKIDSLNRYMDENIVAKVRKRFPAKAEPMVLGGVKCFLLTPSTYRDANRRCMLVHLHGGAYVIGAGESGFSETLLMAHYTATRVIFVDYRMPPDNPFPAAIDDAVAVWRAVAKKWKSSNVGIGGSSAGGGLTLAVVRRFRQLGLPIPGAAFVGTPWADLTAAGDTIHTNEWIDGTVTTHAGFLDAAARLYAGREQLTHPLVSPLYGDFKGFPPTILVSGTRDLLLSDTVRVHRKLRQAGVDASLNVIEGLSHDQYNDLCDSPESQDVWTEVARFFDARLGK
jgi:monoterpene epsilon-lactone hydrolase